MDLWVYIVPVSHLRSNLSRFSKKNVIVQLYKCKNNVADPLWLRKLESFPLSSLSSWNNQIRVLNTRSTRYAKVCHPKFRARRERAQSHYAPCFLSREIATLCASMQHRRDLTTTTLPRLHVHKRVLHTFYVSVFFPTAVFVCFCEKNFFLFGILLNSRSFCTHRSSKTSHTNLRILNKIKNNATSKFSDNVDVIRARIYRSLSLSELIKNVIILLSERSI